MKRNRLLLTDDQLDHLHQLIWGIVTSGSESKEDELLLNKVDKLVSKANQKYCQKG